MDNKYVRCSSHCKHLAWSATETQAHLDELSLELNQKIDGEVTTLETRKRGSGDFKYIDMTFVASQGDDEEYPDYPVGFTKDNCIILSVTELDVNENYSNKLTYITDVSLGENSITVKTSNSGDSNVTTKCKILLMKVYEADKTEYITEKALEQLEALEQL